MKKIIGGTKTATARATGDTPTKQQTRELQTPARRVH